MSRLNKAPAILQLACELGLNWQRHPVSEIMNFCIAKIAGWLTDTDQVRTIVDLEILVSRKLQLVFEEVWSDKGLEDLIKTYVTRGEIVFASLRDGLDASTFGMTIERRHADADAPDYYVAVIDCRGSKATRRFFTRWHEIAHVLTMPRQLTVPFYRSSKDPIERLMDEIAGALGFYDPIFRPVLLQHQPLTFDSVEGIRRQVCPNASFQATLIACATRLSSPAIYLEAGKGYKQAEEAQLTLRQTQTSLFPVKVPTAKLRALVVVPNNIAKERGIRIDRNMEVPAESVIAKLFHNTPELEALFDVKTTENLSTWRHSDGTTLNDIDVSIEPDFDTNKYI